MKTCILSTGYFYAEYNYSYKMISDKCRFLMMSWSQLCQTLVSICYFNPLLVVRWMGSRTAMAQRCWGNQSLPFFVASVWKSMSFSLRRETRNGVCVYIYIYKYINMLFGFKSPKRWCKMWQVCSIGGHLPSVLFHGATGLFCYTKSHQVS